MTEVSCLIQSEDRIRVSHDTGSVALRVVLHSARECVTDEAPRGTLFLTPKDAKAIRKAIKAAEKEAEAYGE